VPWISGTIFGLAAIAVIEFYEPPSRLVASTLRGRADAPALADARPSVNAYGQSGAVHFSIALPGQLVEYPLEVSGDPESLAYQWVHLGDSLPADSLRPLSGATVLAPPAPGFYRLTVISDTQRRIVDELTLAVLVPFSQKLGATLNGYRIGTYVAERINARNRERPAGFVEVTSAHADLPVSKHFKLSDFLTRDGQQTWPRYAALNPRLLDKLELVIAELARVRGDSAPVAMSVSVNSGYRTPLYNLVNHFADDSRHLYGDAADVAIDANGDGRYSLADSRLVALAVDAVERDHPELAGGLGLYSGPKYRTPYVHIDARGHRARWRG
jgi:uncharacterized protein YcbK (DUF882 family)